MKKIILAGIILCAGVILFIGKERLYPKKQSNEAITTAKGDVDNFALLDHKGEWHELYRHNDAKAVVIISQGNDCPIIQKYSSVITEQINFFSPQGVVFYLLNSNTNDDRKSIIQEAETFEFKLPILMDPSQVVAEVLGVTRTCEAVVIDPRGWKIIYRGAIDDRLDYGVNKITARNHYLKNALEALVQGKKTELKTVPAKGCLITFKKPKSISYEKEIAPVFINKCLNCHSEHGKYVPFFDSYEKVAGWTAMSKETILTDRMPPYSIDRHYGEYDQDLSLTSEEKRLLVSWFNAGAPKESSEGDPLKSYVPKRKFRNFDKLPKLMYRISTDKPAIIPPEGTTEYLYTQLGGEVPHDIWLRGFNTISTNPRQLHHLSLIVVSKPLDFYKRLAEKQFPEKDKFLKNRPDGDLPTFLLASMINYENKNPDGPYFRSQIFAAGKKQPFYFGEKFTVHIPKGSFLILEAHYMGNGKTEQEQTTVEFLGSKNRRPGKFLLKTKTIINRKFSIPPMVKNFAVLTNEWKPEQDIMIISALAHLHMRGKSVVVEKREPGSKVFEPFISVPNYYYGWQTGSQIKPKKPVPVKKGSSFRGECRYDNSPQNPNNPDPMQTVNFGQRVDKTEMCNIHLNYFVKKGNEKLKL